MSILRKRALPAGWYPSDSRAIEERLLQWTHSQVSPHTGAVACVVPHAGWEFSGELAFAGIRSLRNPVDTVVVVGGHLPPVPSILVCSADLFETPLGHLQADHEVVDALSSHFDVADDDRPDNTVEIHLPIVKYVFGGSKLVYMRVAPTKEAIDIGERLHEASKELSRKIVVIGSTDLTHYGPSYGFSPAGSGAAAVGWVRDVNDKEFLDYLMNLQIRRALEHANKQRSACSSGAAAVAAAFARASGVKDGKLIGRRMSCDLYASDSFVGYGTIAYIP